jgi:hypothetical protein
MWFENLFGNRLSRRKLSMIIEKIFATREVELDCDECFEHMDRYAETELRGRKLDEALTLVEDHLSKCGDCREEYGLLIEALRTEVKI